MKTGTLNIMTVLFVLALTGCSTVSVEELGQQYGRPLLSAVDAQSMIRVEVTTLEPLDVEETTMASSFLERVY